MVQRDESLPSTSSTRVIPSRVDRWERIGIVLRAMLGVHLPRQAMGPADRAERAWQWTEHRRRLEWLAARPRLQRTVVVGVVGHRSTELAHSLSAVLTQLRHDRVVLVAERAPFQHTAGPTTMIHSLESIESGLRHAGTTSSERDALFARTDQGALFIPLARAAGMPDVATFRRLLDSLTTHAGVVIIDAGSSTTPENAPADLCDQIIVSTTGAGPTMSTQTIVAAWGADDSEDPEEHHSAVRMSDDPDSILELAVVSIAGWAQLGAATPLPISS